MVKPAARRMIVSYFKNSYKMSERRSCRLIGVSVSCNRYQEKVRLEDEVIKAKLIELAARRIRFGYRRLKCCLELEGFKLNYKKVYRLYKEANLALRRKQGKKLKAQDKRPLKAANEFNKRWSIDFISDKLTDGRKIRCLNIVDDYSRYNMAIEASSSLPAVRVTTALSRVISKYGRPKAIVLDNGPEFRSKLFSNWAVKNNIELLFIDPGKPMQNAYVESFNGKFRDECLNQHWFSTIQEAKEVIANWREDYNKTRPHSSLGYLSPEEFIKQQNLEKQKATSSCNNQLGEVI